MPKLPHILVTDTASTEPYTSPSMGRKTFSVPPRQRETHGQRLLGQFETVRAQSQAAVEEQKAFGIDAGNGIYVQFESDPDFELKFESLDARQSGLELLAVKQVDHKTLATVFVPEGKLNILTTKLDDYLNTEKDTVKGNPKNKNLIESINSIRQAALAAIWTDTQEAFPDEDEIIWWEVWLRVGDDRQAYINFFRDHAEQLGLQVGSEELYFPDRTVVTASGTKAQMSRSINLLNCIAELRKAKETADFFISMPRVEQMDWIADTVANITPPSDDSPAICILDTGVNNGHPLLQPILKNQDLHSCNPAWNVADHHGHGTEMSGLAAYGDLTELLSYQGPITLTHGLESVKILPPTGQNHPNQYGPITMEAIGRAEVSSPTRKRSICLAVTTTDFRDAGRPSSWSATIDALCSGATDETQRLILVSAGNTDEAQRHHFPNNNMTEGVHDPGQAWNAVTVGAYTEKMSIDPAVYPGYEPIAPFGDLSPSSCTSMDWSRPWPLKPDLVMEGGNMAIDPYGTADYIDSLNLLTTNCHYQHIRPLTNIRETSAATALAARMAAILQANYQSFWPETIRALLIHSAEWTEGMLNRFAPFPTKQQYENLIRYCGYGVPNLERALWSANNSLTLIAQDSLQPFDKKKSRGVTRDLHLHDIPWPKELLQNLGEIPVEMKVTLSYFIEPNPARRGWSKKYSYSSHGLRFEVKNPVETLDAFKKRINKAARDEETGTPGSSPGDVNWTLGKNLQKLGSVHTDTWKGTASELAERGHIAIFPVMGWWKENLKQERWGNQARYALVITIKTPETEIDLYTPVAAMVQQAVEIEV